jgi:hypothetical protein
MPEHGKEAVMKKHTMTLLGGTRGELRVPADVLLEMIGALLEGARQATRFFVEGESTRKGPRPAWLDAACNVEVTGLTAGSAVVALEAPTLADAAPDRFGGTHQVSLFAEPHHLVNASNSAVDIFAGVLASVVQGDRDRVLADRALLDTCVRFARAARDGFDGVQLEGIAGLAAPLVVRRDDVSKIELLRDETPGPKAVRVTGTLDTISATKSDVVLALTDGTTVAARLDAHDNKQLKALSGSRVVVSGIAQFRPSGTLLVIDVEHLGPARDGDELFERAPKVAAKPVASLLPQDEATGVSAFFGTWPGDETDEELLSVLEAIR